MNILITGGSGFIGKSLTQTLEKDGYKVAWLSRKPNKSVKTFIWNPKENQINSESIEWADAVINLAGASVADKRWSDSYKKEIYDSRIRSTKLLVETINSSERKPTVLLSASATGYYGSFDTCEPLLAEKAPSGNDFLALVTRDWEQELFRVDKSIRTCALRIGIVLGNDGGALTKLVTPIKYGVGAPLASGNQAMAWIHIDDVVGLFLEALKNANYSGAINTVAPQLLSNKEMTAAIAKKMKRPLILPHVPEFALKLLLGEFASFVCKGTPVIPEKAQQLGYQFNYPNITDALDNLL